MTEDHLKKISHLIRQYGYRQFSPLKRDKHARFNGIISDGQGKKYFVKAVVGKNSYAYKSLYRESQVTQYLSKLTKKIHLSHHSYRLYVPTITEIISQDEMFCLITKYIEGEKLLHKQTALQAEILLTTLNLVAKLSEKIDISTIKPYLKNYTRKAVLLSLPIRFIKAIILTPSAFQGLIKVCCKSLLLFSPNVKGYGLVHADINMSNIILHKNAIYLTDWEEAGWGINTYNTITPLCVHWQDQTLRDKLFHRLKNSGQKKIAIPLLAYRTLMLFNQNIQKGDKKRKRDFMILKFLSKEYGRNQKYEIN